LHVGFVAQIRRVWQADGCDLGGELHVSL